MSAFNYAQDAETFQAKMQAFDNAIAQARQAIVDAQDLLNTNAPATETDFDDVIHDLRIDMFEFVEHVE